MAVASSSRRTSSSKWTPSNSRKSSVVHPSSTKSPPSLKSAHLNGYIGPYASDPDQIFSTYTVAEVKAMVHRVRADADSKQEELRLMVGERYRDLLQASTSIVEIAQLSKHVEQLVTQMEETTSLQGQTHGSSNVMSRAISNDDQLQTFQCLAAHVKLLVDASEYLWRFLERGRYFHATWLFLLCRVVYRSLMEVDDDATRRWTSQGVNILEQFPLVQRQWDSLSQFRAQISHKATLSLRDQTFNLPDVCGTILSLHLLDSQPFLEGLDVFLKQRSRSLSSLFGAQLDSAKHSPPTSLLGLTSVPDDGVWHSIKQILEAMSCTVGVVRAIFQEAPTPLLLELVQFIQVENYASERLPSELQLSTSSLLASLPGGTVFSSLPSDIKSYRPFIDSNSGSVTVDREAVSVRLRSWLVDSCTRGKDSFDSWLRKLPKIDHIRKTNNSMHEWLSQDRRLGESDESLIRETLGNAYRTRTQDIFQAQLDKLSSSFSKRLDDYIATIGNSLDGGDPSPCDFLLSAAPHPVFAQSGLGPLRAEASLQKFRTSIRHRIDGFTPAIESIYTNMESIAKSLRLDLNTIIQSDELFGTLSEDYLTSVESTLESIASQLERVLRESIEAENLSSVTLCGRLAYLFSSSCITTELLCKEDFSSAFKLRVMEIHDLAVNKWATVVSAASTTSFTSRGQEASTEVPSRPSAVLANLLNKLSDSIFRWGFFCDDAHRSSIVTCLLTETSKDLANAVLHTPTPLPPSIIWDLHFFKHLCGAWGECLAQSSEVIGQRLKDSTKTGYPLSLEEVERSVSRSMDQMRLLVAPVLPNLPSPSAKSPKPSLVETPKRPPNTSRIREVTTEDSSPVLVLAKPSARFGSLWVSEQ